MYSETIPAEHPEQDSAATPLPAALHSLPRFYVLTYLATRTSADVSAPRLAGFSLITCEFGVFHPKFGGPWMDAHSAHGVALLACLTHPRALHEEGEARSAAQ